MWPALGSRAGSHLLTATSGAFTERPESSLALALVKCVKRALCNVQKFSVPILSQPPESSLALALVKCALCNVQKFSVLIRSQPLESSLALVLVLHWTKV